MDNSKIDPNIKLILDLRNNKGVFPLSSDSAIITHSPGGEITYLDSVIDYLYQLVANKVRLYTEKDGSNARGKAYPATMGLRDANNITSLLNNVEAFASLLDTLLQLVNNIDPTEDITSLNSIISQLQEEFANLMQASEYSYLEIKFSDSAIRPTNNLDDPLYWKDRPLSNFNHLWLGIRTVTVKRGENGEAIITKSYPIVVSLLGPKGDRGEQGPPGNAGSNGQNGESYRPVLMYKWTDSRSTVPDTPTDPLNQGWSENPGTSIGNNKYLWMSLNYKKMSNNTYLGEWSTPVCLSGEDGTNASLGLNGPVVRFRGEYTANTLYINASLDTTLSSTDIRYIDVVMIGVEYYMVKPLANNTRTTTVSPLLPGQTDWQEATGFSFIAAEALYARNAHIDDLSSYEFVVLDNPDDNNIVAGMTGGNVENSVVNTNSSNPVRIWAGSHALNNLDLTSNDIPFKVFQDGKLKATNAEIKGNLSLDSLSLTGNLGSYYYNEESITLPQVDTNKHTVIFIITTSNATKVYSHYGDVLFAFSNDTITTIPSTDFATLEKYKIYLAISIQDGIAQGWLILNLNSLQKPSNVCYHTEVINTHDYAWSVLNEASALNEFKPLITLNKNLKLLDYEIPDFTSLNPNTIYFTLLGSIKLKNGGITIATIQFKQQDISGWSLGPGILGPGSIDFITVEDLSDSSVYGNSIGDKVYVTSNILGNTPDILFVNGNLKVQWPNSILDLSTVTVLSELRLVESFSYPKQTSNSPSPVTTTTVGSNGLVIDNGIVVAIDMPVGAVINSKDCIVYKDVTLDVNHEKYEVTNYGDSGVSIGNYTLTPRSSVLVKAAVNKHLDFSDINNIDINNIEAISVQSADPIEEGDTPLQ